MVAGNIERTDINLLLVSGALNKGMQLKGIAAELPESTLVALGIAALNVDQVPCPIPIDEKNGWKSAPSLYKQKALDTHTAMGASLRPDQHAVVNDVHPKLGEEGQTFSVVLTKYAHPETVTTRSDREDVLSAYIAENFSHFDASEHVLLRVGSGSVPVTRDGIGEVVHEKLYVRYDRNPIPDEKAARDFLQWSAENHTNYHREKNNLNLDRSIVVAGGVLEEDLVRWSVRDRKIAVNVRGRSNDPMNEMEAIGDGFTPDMVRVLLHVIRGVATAELDFTLPEKERARLLPRKCHNVIWSSQEQGFVARYTGDYRL